MAENTQLTVVSQREIGFYDDEITAVQVEGGGVYVPIRPLCDQLGIAWQPQARKLNSDPVLSDVSASITIRLRVNDSRGAINSTMVCLPLDYVNGWIFGINANRVKEDVRPKLIRYQREVYRVLYEAFARNAVTVASDAMIDEMLKGSSPEAQAYQIAMAVANMARQQLAIRARVDSAESRLIDHEARLQIIEADRGDDGRFITNSQAVQIAQAVKTIALELNRRSGRNEFGGVYGELYRRFDIPGYKQLPAKQYGEAMQFMRDWWQSLTDESETPF